MILLCVWVIMLSMPSLLEAQPTGCPSDMSHYWKLDDSSQPYLDSYGINDAVCTNCPSGTAGIVGGAQQFSLTSQVSVADDGTFDWSADDNFTIELWMKTDSSSTCSGNQALLGRNSPFWWIGCLNNTGVAYFELEDTSGSGASVVGTTDLTDGNWHHIVAVRDTNSIHLYVDGVKHTKNITYSSGFNSAAPLTMGWLNLGGGYHFVGSMDEVAMYNRALSDNEILSHYYLTRDYCEMCDSPIRIMPLGDSITYGRNDAALEPGGPSSPNYVVGYRQSLYLSLWNSGVNMDFVGSLQDGELATPVFDLDHQGMLDSNGFTAQELTASVFDLLSANPADVLLLHIGTNDIRNTTAADIENILDEIDRYDPDITVLLARIINTQYSTDPRSPYITQFNNDVAVMAQNRKSDKIIIVDQEKALTYPDDMHDMLHPSTGGYDIMAGAWLNTLNTFLPLCADVAPTIISTPITSAIVSQLYTYDVNALGNPAPTYSLLSPPSGMTIDEATGVISWIPGALGSYDIVVQAENTEGIDLQDFAIQVTLCPSDMSHYWKLDDSSQPYLDSYGINDAVCTNCPSGTAGIVGGAQQFSLTSQVSVADDGTFDWSADDNFTIELWMKTDSSSTCSGNQALLGRNSPFWWIGCLNNTGVAYFELEDTSGSGASVVGTTDLTDGNWHHIVAVRDTNSIHLYVDGVKHTKNITYSSGFNSAAPLTMGWLNLGGGYHFVGSMDEVAMYNRALSDDEIERHYTLGLTGDGYCGETTAYALTVDGSGNGSGTVTATGINCVIADGFATGDCTEIYDENAPVTLSAIADVGSDFKGWFGACTGTGSCNLIMDGDKEVTAQFDIETHTLLISGSGNGSGTVTATGINCVIADGIATGDCTETYSHGTPVTLTADADSNSTFTGWSGAGCSGSGSCVITMNSDAAVTAALALKTFTINASAPGGNGTINCTSPVNYGGSSTCTITPDAHYHLSALTDNSANVFGSVVNNSYIISNVTANHSVVATFAIDTFTVNASAPGGHGTIFCTSPVSYGGTSTCTITPDAHYHLSALTDNSANVFGSVVNNTYIISNVTANHSVVATFAIDTFTISVEKTGTGSGTVTSNPAGISCGTDCSESYDHDTSVTLTAAAEADSIFTGWNGGGCSGTGSCVVTMTGNVSVTATFKQYLAVLNPNAGTPWTVGTTQPIQWTYTGNIENWFFGVRIDLLKDGLFDRIIAFSPSGNGSNGEYNWSIPSTLPSGNDYQIRVTSNTNGSYTDTSAHFTLIGLPPPSITVASPNGGESWSAGSTRTISWTYTGSPGSYVRILLYKGSSLNRTIASYARIGSNGNGSYNWAIPSNQAAGSDYSIRVTSTSSSLYTDASNSQFTIVGPLPPSITVASPNGGESWSAGSTRTISWTYTGSPGSYVRILLYKGSSLNRTIASYARIGSNGNGSYNWAIPSNQAAGSDYSIRVTSTSNSLYTDASNSQFTIVGPPPPSITVASPNGEESWTAGSTRTISWTYTGSPGSYVRILLYKGNVLTHTIASYAWIGSNGNGLYYWSIPPALPSGDDYQIMVTSAMNSFYTDTTAYFEIIAS
jgi:lysophospholipase L1-like esterase